MSFGGSFGDIVGGITLALNIYTKGFQPDNAATEQYRRLKAVVNNFRGNLLKLDDALIKIAKGPGQGQGQLPDIQDKKQPVVGDFVSTLNECDLFLQENKRLELRSNAIQNLKWYLQQRDRRVADFYQRLLLHSVKVRLVKDYVELELLQDIKADTEDSAFHLEHGCIRATPSAVADEHSLDEAVAQKFEQHKHHNAPLEFELQQGFEALLLLWNQCSGVLGPEAETYILFLRVLWFLDWLKTTESYKNARPGLFYKRAIKKIEKEMILRCRERNKIIPCINVHALVNLPDSAFYVWPTPAASGSDSPASQLMAKENEELVACVNLIKLQRQIDESVAVFKKSNGSFRVLPFRTQYATSPEARTLKSVGEKQDIDPRYDQFIPLYTLPGSPEGEWKIRLLHNGDEKTYIFDSWDTLRIFQTALIGYEMPHDQQEIHCQFSIKDLNCDARVQLWQEPEDDLVLQQSDAGEAKRPAFQRRSSSSSSRSGRSIAQQLNSSLSASRIRLPVMVIFTELKRRKGGPRSAVLFIELKEGIIVDLGACQCKVFPEKCLDLYLKGPGKISVRALVADGQSKDGLDSNMPNLFPFSLPHRERFKKLEHHETKYLMLSFKNTRARDTAAEDGAVTPGLRHIDIFRKELHERIQLRMLETKKRSEAKKELSLRQNDLMDPKRRNSRTTSFDSSSTLQSSSSSLLSRPRLASVPQVEMPDSGSEFAVR